MVKPFKSTFALFGLLGMYCTLGPCAANKEIPHEGAAVCPVLVPALPHKAQGKINYRLVENMAEKQEGRLRGTRPEDPKAFMRLMDTAKNSEHQVLKWKVISRNKQCGFQFSHGKGEDKAIARVFYPE